MVRNPKPTSRVIDIAKDWREEALLVPHEAIRWYDRELMKILNEFDPVSRPSCVWKTKVLFDFLENYYIPCVHHHHDGEENIYNVHILKKCEAQGIPNPFFTIKREHEELMSRLQKISSYRTAFEKQDVKAAEKLAEFKQFFKDFLNFMEDHLAEEEQTYPKILRDCGMTQEEEKAAVGEILQGLGLDGNKKLLPVIMYAMCMWNGTDQMEEWYEAAVPMPIRMLNNNFWLEDFHQNQLRVLVALQNEEEFIPQSPACNVCICSFMWDANPWEILAVAARF